MDAPVEQAGTGIEIEQSAPLPGDIVGVVGTPRGGAEPEVPVALLTRRRGLGGQPGVVELGLVDGCVQRVEFAETTFAGELHGVLHERHAAPLCARLEDAARSMHRLGDLLAVADRQTAGLLAIDVLARLGRQDRGGGVPPVARGDQDGVDVAAGEQFPQVAVEHAVGVAVVLVHEGLALVAPARLHVGDCQAADVGEAEHRGEHVGAPRTDADDAKCDLLARGHGAVEAEDAGGDDHREGRGDRTSGGCAGREAAEQTTPGQAGRRRGIVGMCGGGVTIRLSFRTSWHAHQTVFGLRWL